MSDLFETSTDNIGLHLKNIYQSDELTEESTAEDFSVVRLEGKRRVQRTLKHYNLDAIISVGYRVNSKQGTRFRIWANQVLKDYLTRGYALNEKRLKEQQVKMSDLRICSISSSRIMPSATATSALPPPFSSASWPVTGFSTGMNKSPIQKLYFSGKDVCRPRCCTMGSKSRSE